MPPQQVPPTNAKMPSYGPRLAPHDPPPHPAPIPNHPPGSKAYYENKGITVPKCTTQGPVIPVTGGPDLVMEDDTHMEVTRADTQLSSISKIRPKEPSKKMSIVPPLEEWENPENVTVQLPTPQPLSATRQIRLSRLPALESPAPKTMSFRGSTPHTRNKITLIRPQDMDAVLAGTHPFLDRLGFGTTFTGSPRPQQLKGDSRLSPADTPLAKGLPIVKVTPATPDTQWRVLVGPRSNGPAGDGNRAEDDATASTTPPGSPIKYAHAVEDFGMEEMGSGSRGIWDVASMEKEEVGASGAGTTRRSPASLYFMRIPLAPSNRQLFFSASAPVGSKATGAVAELKASNSSTMAVNTPVERKSATKEFAGTSPKTRAAMKADMEQMATKLRESMGPGSRMGTPLREVENSVPPFDMDQSNIGAATPKTPRARRFAMSIDDENEDAPDGRRSRLGIRHAASDSTFQTSARALNQSSIAIVASKSRLRRPMSTPVLSKVPKPTPAKAKPIGRIVSKTIPLAHRRSMFDIKAPATPSKAMIPRRASNLRASTNLNAAVHTPKSTTKGLGTPEKDLKGSRLANRTAEWFLVSKSSIWENLSAGRPSRSSYAPMTPVRKLIRGSLSTPNINSTTPASSTTFLTLLAPTTERQPRVEKFASAEDISELVQRLNTPTHPAKTRTSLPATVKSTDTRGREGLPFTPVNRRVSAMKRSERLSTPSRGIVNSLDRAIDEHIEEETRTGRKNKFWSC